MNKKQQQKEDILKHGFQLNRIFNTSFGPVELCKKLHRMETRLHSQSESHCNGYLDGEKWEKITERAEKRLDEILGASALGIHVFVNGDPRGYALKIDQKDVHEKNLDIYRDWGGYGILCPEF